jgi:hypothetical protein
MPVDYAKGKIYKLQCENLIYYGSTTQSLCVRMGGHRRNFKCLQNQTRKSITSSFELFKIGEPIITLVEDVKCERKEQLLARERWYIENNECINKVIPCRTKQEYNIDNAIKIKEQHKAYAKEWYNDNAETLKEKHKKYYNENKQRIDEQHKEYRDAHKEETAQFLKKYRANNKDKIKESYEACSAQPWKCECCDKTIRLVSKSGHLKTAKHITKSANFKI